MAVKKIPKAKPEAESIKPTETEVIKAPEPVKAPESIAAATPEATVTTTTTTTTQTTVVKPKYQYNLKNFLVLLFVLGIYTVFVVFFINSEIFSFLKIFIIIFSVVVYLITLFRLVVYIFKGSKFLLVKLFARPKLIPFAIAGLLIFVAVVFLILKNVSFIRDKEFFTLVQDHLASAFYNKEIGDALAANKKVPAGTDWQKISDDNFTIGDSLFSLYPAIGNSAANDYHTVVLDWMIAIETATENLGDWGKLAAQPEIVTISVNDSQLTNYYSEAVTKLAALKEFGDKALRDNDLESMRFIAARLAALDYWLATLEQAQDPGILGLALGKVNAYVGTIPNRKPCISRGGNNLCLQDTRKIVQGVYRSAHNYTVGEPSAPQEWTNSWDTAAPQIEAAGVPVGGAGITVGQDEPAKVPEVLQEFYDGCSARGGVVNGSGGVKTNLPTTESGNTCWYGKGCWDFLTNSGGRYQGGAPNCPKENLIPEPNLGDNIAAQVQMLGDNLAQTFQDIPDLFENITGGTWDGTYKSQFSQAQCSGSNYYSQYLDYSSLLEQALGSSAGGEIMVSNNQVYLFNPITIDGNGRARDSFSVYGTTVAFDLQFTAADKVNSVTGQITIEQSYAEISSSCVINISGVRE